MTEAEKAFINENPAEIGAVRHLAHLAKQADRIMKIADDLRAEYYTDTADGLKAVELALMLERAQKGGGNLDKFIEEGKAEQESIKAGCKHD